MSEIGTSVMSCARQGLDQNEAKSLDHGVSARPSLEHCAALHVKSNLYLLLMSFTEFD